MPISATELTAIHTAQQSKVLAQAQTLTSSSSSSSAESFPLDNIAEGTFTLFSPDLLALQPSSFFEEYDAECDEWLLEFFDTDFANELYPGSCKPGEIQGSLHVGEKHVKFQGVPRPEAVGAAAGDGEGRVVKLVQTLGEEDGEEKEKQKAAAPAAEGKELVEATVRFFGEGCLVVEVKAGDLLKGVKNGEKVVKMYGVFEEDGDEEEDILEFVPVEGQGEAVA